MERRAAPLPVNDWASKHHRDRDHNGDHDDEDQWLGCAA
jgi:hypothetical protein